MTIHAYTSFSFSYLNRARVLAETLREQHPDWVIWAVLTDKAPEDLDEAWAEGSFDKVVTAEELFGEQTGPWLFGMDVVEACTAVKGAALQLLLSQPGCEKVFYFDPDIAVFNSMSEVSDLLDQYSIVLTPHQVDPEPKSDITAILDNEAASLTYGVFNLGFIAVNNDSEGNRFAAWWADRLYDWCHDRLDIGIFVDQKWCNLIPCFFDNVKVLRDPGYNVASWNLSQRTMSFDSNGTALINDRPLRFYHFTKLGPIGDAMTVRYAKDNLEVYELWLWYRNAVVAATDDAIPPRYWYYGYFDNGEAIPKPVRTLYRDRKDLRDAFSQPQFVGNGFYNWVKAETDLLQS
ncbi:hypothetical protein [Roseibium suaedae]|uniref:Glycosyl transferase n=1 Tax=Roseibium suaedae TaxID=735517 RepID=A0A1M7P704_9HYPH|nr:hypothetical protein [Roseibium suaedae]SHN12414.1 hypothetical protein SAMN05444272_4158 [Roseibium suaedae]